MTQYKVHFTYRRLIDNTAISLTNTVSTITQAYTWLMTKSTHRDSSEILSFGYEPIEVEEDPDFAYDRCGG